MSPDWQNHIFASKLRLQHVLLVKELSSLTALQKETFSQWLLKTHFLRTLVKKIARRMSQNKTLIGGIFRMGMSAQEISLPRGNKRIHCCKSRPVPVINYQVHVRGSDGDICRCEIML